MVQTRRKQSGHPSNPSLIIKSIALKMTICLLYEIFPFSWGVLLLSICFYLWIFVVGELCCAVLSRNLISLWSVVLAADYFQSQFV